MGLHTTKWAWDVDEITPEAKITLLAMSTIDNSMENEYQVDYDWLTRMTNIDPDGDQYTGLKDALAELTERKLIVPLAKPDENGFVYDWHINVGAE